MSAKNTVMNLPDSLGKYKIEGFLGEGAYAHVYQALDTSLDRRVALKVLKTQLLADPSFLTHFHQEAKTMAKVDHPAIVRIYTVEALDSYHFLTMQFADQGALADRLAVQGGLSWAETLDLLAPLTTALSYAH
jgi:serine/threonine-protein kinase